MEYYPELMSRLELPADSKLRCIDCGRAARYKIVHEGGAKSEYYCEACC